MLSLDRGGRGREGKGFFFGKKKQKTFEPLVGRVRGWALVYGEAQELMKFFGSFCSQKEQLGWDFKPFSRALPLKGLPNLLAAVVLCFYI